MTVKLLSNFIIAVKI